MNELVSVIVTSYNHAEYLDQRLCTLLEQTYPNKEIFVIDDCSTDPSRDVLSKYEKFPEVKITYLARNFGHAYACNYGASLARGEYLMFAECDDYSDPRHLARLYENIVRSDEIGVAYSGSNIVDSQGRYLSNDFEGNIKAFRTYCAKNTLIPRQKMQRFLLIACVIPNMSAALCRKKYFSRAGGLSTSYRACSDWDFWCRMAKFCDFYYVNEPLNNFRRHPTTIRQSFGLDAQLLEIYAILNNASLEFCLNKVERIGFKINLGYVFAHEALFSCQKKWNDLSRVSRTILKLGKMFSLFFVLGFLRSGVEILFYKVCKELKRLQQVL